MNELDASIINDEDFHGDTKPLGGEDEEMTKELQAKHEAKNRAKEAIRRYEDRVKKAE